ncbi:MAG: hypothetical protein QOD78_609, partial [Chloroflexota bacterium]|nr:hypothetical protein [Chloroflexota bacterium]
MNRYTRAMDTATPLAPHLTP